jgi:hypothetical protein
MLGEPYLGCASRWDRRMQITGSDANVNIRCYNYCFYDLYSWKEIYFEVKAITDLPS